VSTFHDVTLATEIRCPMCSPEHEVGAVVRTCLDGVVACEGCHRQRGYVWIRDRRAALQAAIRSGERADDRRVLDRSLVLFEGADTLVLPYDTPREEIERLLKETK
jgi:uncharacterized Zn finger protein